ncbi:MAG: Bcr/CflA family efflux MFS transporter [Pseudomonadota bacterium]
MQSRLALVVLLAGLTALGPFSLQILAPALPVIAEDLAVAPAAAQLLLSLSLVAMAAATLIWGPLSDQLGRRPMMLAGVALAVIGSVVAALAPVLELVILGRLMQAGGAIAGMVLGRAIAQDLFGREGAAATIGQITAVMVAAPMLAPAISGLLIESTGWRTIFWAVGLLAILMLAAAFAMLRETAPERSTTARSLGAVVHETATSFRLLSCRRDFWSFAGYGVSSLGAFLFFVGAAPFVMAEAYGASPTVYGLWFIVLALGYMAANLACGPVTRALGTITTLRLGAILALMATLVGLGFALAGLVDPLTMIGPMLVQSLGAGLSVPNALAGATATVPERAGAASGLMGASQFLGAAVTTQIAGLLPHDSALPLFLGMTLLLGAGTVLHLALSRRSQRTADA